MVSRWIELRGGRFAVKIGKIESGQGTVTALVRIAASELCTPMSRLDVVTARTDIVPDEGPTTGSHSMETTGRTIREAAASARRLVLAAARAKFDLPVDRELQLRGDVINLDGAPLCSLAAIPESALDAPFTTDGLSLDPDRPSSQVPGGRIDLPAKVLGRPAFIQDFHPQGLVFGRIVRPDGPSMRVTSCEVDEAELARRGVTLVRRHDFIGVIAAREEDAVAAGRAVHKATTRAPRPASKLRAPGAGAAIPQGESLMTCETDDAVVGISGDTDAAGLPNAAATVSLTFTRPFIAHASLAPSCATAWWRDGRLEVWSSTQAILPALLAFGGAACGRGRHRGPSRGERRLLRPHR
jgi:CO/xanthine dehydrogenase Mo-binding subunit